MKTTVNKLIVAVLLIGLSSSLWAGDKDTPKYYFSKEVTGSYDEILQRIKSSLKEVEFGVVSEMMINETLNEKAGANLDTYAILGICNPSFAKEAIQLEENVGLMLPCKAIIRKVSENKFVVAFQNPQKILKSVDNDQLNELASEVTERLKKALSTI